MGLAKDETCDVTFQGTVPILSNSKDTKIYTTQIIFRDKLGFSYPRKVELELGNLPNGDVAMKLPANLPEGVSRLVAFSFINRSKITATDISINIPTVTGLTWLNSKCPKALSPDSVCTISGYYKPPIGTVGAITIPVTFHYNEGSEINLSTSTSVDDVAVAGSVTKPLPVNDPEGVPQPISFTFTNGANGTATEVKANVPTMDGLVWTNRICPQTLSPHAVCTISGYYTPPIGHTGAVSIPVSLSYKEGDVVNLETNTNVKDIAVSGLVTTSLPANMPEGVAKSIGFTFTNGPNGKATGIVVNRPSIPGLRWDNTCPSELAPNQACEITGTYTPPYGNIGLVDIPISFNYDQGNEIDLHTSVSVDDIAITGLVTTPLPPIIKKNASEPQTVTFTFTNGPHGKATGIVVNRPSIPGLTWNTTCPSELAANQACEITGTYTPPNGETGLVDIPVSLNYDQGSQIALNTETLLSDNIAFIVNSSEQMNQLTRCGVNLATGILSNCTNSGATLLNLASGIALDISHRVVYITNINDNEVILCDVDVNTGKVSNCRNSRASGPYRPQDIEISLKHRKAFVADPSGNRVFHCDIDQTTHFLKNCAEGTTDIFKAPTKLFFNTTNNRLLVVNTVGKKISSCDVQSSGNFNNCTDVLTTDLSTPTGIVLNSENNAALITDAGGHNLVFCDYNNASGNITDCRNSQLEFNSPTSIALNSDDTGVFVTNYNNDTVTYCRTNLALKRLTECKNSGATHIREPYEILIW